MFEKEELQIIKEGLKIALDYIYTYWTDIGEDSDSEEAIFTHKLEKILERLDK